ncbi:MAG: DUF1648 domain-containing protein [Chloroflexi bacterium]|uniref:DUF1648 domain-containing protein n=1 Tax=Candidatus Chlorohelix allophototropha TaxID=3003348 RepID=A0A8T7M5P3_9CHLR|nr:DUF1648 domain-containing protein [Chloroflexota bacterium]WJW69349.1 DUF1648 domain-containing protein [Chloroflexota bacterium L227-S17]
MVTSKRPVLHLHYSTGEKILEATGLVLVGLAIGFTINSWGSLPERVPTHFNVLGQPDSYGEKGTFIIVPVILTILYLSLIGVSRIPHYFNYPWNITPQNAEGQYRLARQMLLLLRVEIAIVFFYIHWQGLEVSFGRSSGLGVWFLPIFLVLVFGTLIIYIIRMAKVRE